MPFFSRLPHATHPADENCKRRNPSKGYFEQLVVLKEEMAWLGSSRFRDQSTWVASLQWPDAGAPGPRGSGIRDRARFLPSGLDHGRPPLSLAFCRLAASRGLSVCPRRCKAPPPSVAQSRAAVSLPPGGASGTPHALRSLPPVDSDPQAAEPARRLQDLLNSERLFRATKGSQSR